MGNIYDIAEIDPQHTKIISGFIPDDIFGLLWFPDGPFKNIDPNVNKNRFEVDGIIFEFSYGIGGSGSIEPSAIFYKLPIKPADNIEEIPKLPYFPSYAGMTPEQRWNFLTWLKNIDSITDIGNVFVFYYGLERHLFFGKYEQAFKTVLRLRQNHRNNSFLHYSNNALMAACLIYDRPDLFNNYINSEENYEKNKLSDIYLIAKYGMGLNLSADELIALSNEIGFSNQRYIKSDRKLFGNELKKILIQKYTKDEFPFNLYPIKNWPLKPEAIMANYSIDSNKRVFNLPCIKEYNAFKSEVFKLLEETHENVKQIITKIRKTTKFMPEKNINNVLIIYLTKGFCYGFINEYCLTSR